MLEKLKKTQGNLIKFSVLALMLFLIFSSISYASPLSEKKAKAREIKSQVEELDMEISNIGQKYNQAQDKLFELKNKIGKNERRLKVTKAKLKKNKAILNKRVKGMYLQNKSVTMLEFILNTANFAQLITNFDFLQRIGNKDTSIVKAVTADKQRVENTKKVLASAKNEQEQAVSQIESNKNEIEERLENRKKMLEGVEAEVAQLQEQEEAAARAAAAAAARAAEEAQEQLQRASNPDPGTTPGSPPAQGPAPTIPASGGIVEVAMAQMGKPYQWGASGPDSFDCSGLVVYAYQVAYGRSVPHYTGSLFAMGQEVSQADLQPGDLVFFRADLGHMGIYIGGGQMVHAPQTGDVVKISSAFRGDYYGARRI